ncbi:hypothetical protein CHS0354_005118 [Potamilus streckersoni]|uniref:Uncharacterized protein n=1 Tax=Potamilus streckersoni TaxID=2493646 RepID=A0AAE0SH52_9BIVA|nr:hypothetical protein CHS0354_005118 [Potamilus streckersoni]
MVLQNSRIRTLLPGPLLPDLALVSAINCRPSEYERLRYARSKPDYVLGSGLHKIPSDTEMKILKNGIYAGHNNVR